MSEPASVPVSSVNETVPEEAVQEEVQETNDASAEAPRNALDEGSQSLPGLDFDPSAEIAQEAAAEFETEAADSPAEGSTEPKSPEMKLEKPEEMDDREDDVEGSRLEEHESVVVEEIGEFGVDSSNTMEVGPVETGDTASDIDASVELAESKSVSRKASPCKDEDSMDVEAERSAKEETKVIVKGSGGFVLKVNQDSVVVVGINNNNNSNNSNYNDQLQAGSSDQKVGYEGCGMNAEDEEEDGDSDDAGDWRPPSPDPRYKNLPPVQKGSDMSGLCSIM